MDFRRAAIRGISWIGLLRGSTRIVSFIKIALVARILGPELYGHYGIALLVLALLEVFTETGVNVVLIQKRKNIDEYIPTAWVVSILRGIIIALAIAILAQPVAGFFNTPEAVGLLLLLALVPFIRGFVSPSIVKFQRDLLFQKEFFYRFSIFTIDAISAVYLTYLLRSPVGLILGNIIGDLYGTIVSYFLIKPRPKLSFDAVKVREVVGRGKWVTATGIFQYLFREGDDIVVGRLLGAGALGIYQLAYRIATMPISEIADVVGKVTFPLFAKISDNKRALRRAYAGTTAAVVGISLIFGILLFIFAKNLVMLALGEEWLAAVPVLRVVVVYAVIRSAMDPSIQVLLALDKQEYSTVITLIGIVGLALTIIPLVNAYGVVGAGLSTIIAILVSLPPTVYFTLSALKKARTD